MCNFQNEKVQQMYCSLLKEMYFGDKNMATNNHFPNKRILDEILFLDTERKTQECQTG